MSTTVAMIHLGRLFVEAGNQFRGRTGCAGDRNDFHHESNDKSHAGSTHAPSSPKSKSSFLDFLPFPKGLALGLAISFYAVSLFDPWLD